MSIDFDRAIDIAKENAEKLLKKAKDFELEAAIIENNNYEITLSFVNTDIENKLARATQDNGIGFIMAALAKRREEKIFIVNKNGEFKGFKNPK